MNIKPSKLERFFAKYEFSVPYLLCTSDCESFTIEDLYRMDDTAEERFKHFHLGYTESLGNPELRETIAGLYNNSRGNDIIVCAGAEEGIFVFMNVLLKPGDHLIVQSPTYQSLYEIGSALGCHITEWHMDASDNWELDVNFLKDHITPATKAIVLNFPANPTGYLPSADKLNEIIELARQHNLYIFADEVYRFLEYREEDRLPAICDVYEKGVSLNVLAKSFGLAGLRIGWVVIKEKELFEKFAAFKDFTTICSSGPSEFFATLALKHKDDIIKRNMSIIQHNLKQLDLFFRKYSDLFQVSPPKAGPLLFPRFNGLIKEGNIMDADAFCRELIDKSGVLLMPGSMFNCKDPAKHVRFGFGRKNMPDALDRVDKFLEGQI